MFYLGMFAFPYDQEHPKRMFYQHTLREFYTNTTLNERFRSSCVSKEITDRNTSQKHGDIRNQISTETKYCGSPNFTDSGYFVNSMDYLNMRSFRKLADVNQNGQFVDVGKDAGDDSVSMIARASPILCGHEVVLHSISYYVNNF